MSWSVADEVNWRLGEGGRLFTPAPLRGALRAATALSLSRLAPLGHFSPVMAVKNKWGGGAKNGGAKRDRTADLLHAMQALSQLSYGPNF